MEDYKRINICIAIDCPYFRKTDNQGCTFYVNAVHCHLTPREGFVETQYSLWAEESKVPKAREDNDKFLYLNERYKRDIFMKQNLEEWKDLEFPSREIIKQD